MERLPSADSIPEIPLTLKGKIKMKNVGYEIIIWSGGDNHITGEIATGTVGIFDPDEHKWALMDYMQKIESLMEEEEDEISLEDVDKKAREVLDLKEGQYDDDRVTAFWMSMIKGGLELLMG